MRQFTRFTLCVFLLVILTAGTCQAVTVPGHDGTSLALSQIGDIIRHVTGQTEGDMSFRKESLLVTMLLNSGVQGYYLAALYVYSFDGQGNYRDAGEGEWAVSVRSL